MQGALLSSMMALPHKRITYTQTTTGSSYFLTPAVLVQTHTL